MELTTEQLQKIKVIELNILEAFINICDKLSLRYYMMGGTMLGTVRHQGFIPWDDDIDVGMVRRDYEIFKEKAQELLPEYYFLQNMDTDNEYPHNFMKIRDSRTTFVETSLSKLKINHGVFIDIFPLDYYPDSKLMRGIFDFRVKVMNLRMRNVVIIPDDARHSPVQEAVLSIVSKITCLRYPNFKRMQKSREHLYKKENCGLYIGNFCGAWGKKEIVPAEWYGEGCKAKFEGIEVMIPAEYDKWLTQVYGNYMKLPPENKRVTHHYTDIIDFDNPYTKYIK